MPTMSNRETSVCREYEKLILNRGTGVNDPLIPANHTVDWNDQPSRFKIYRDSERILLSDHIPAKLGSLQGSVPRTSGARTSSPLRRCRISSFFRMAY